MHRNLMLIKPAWVFIISVPSSPATGGGVETTTGRGRLWQQTGLRSHPTWNTENEGAWSSLKCVNY